MNIRCSKCGKNFDFDKYYGLCPKCGRVNRKDSFGDCSINGEVYEEHEQAHEDIKYSSSDSDGCSINGEVYEDHEQAHEDIKYSSNDLNNMSYSQLRDNARPYVEEQQKKASNAIIKVLLFLFIAPMLIPLFMGIISFVVFLIFGINA